MRTPRVADMHMENASFTNPLSTSASSTVLLPTLLSSNFSEAELSVRRGLGSRTRVYVNVSLCVRGWTVRGVGGSGANEAPMERPSEPFGCEAIGEQTRDTHAMGRSIFSYSFLGCDAPGEPHYATWLYTVWGSPRV